MNRKSKFCHKCGSEIPFESKFCPVCGEKQVLSDQFRRAFEMQVVDRQTSPLKKKARPTSITIASILSALFGAFELLGSVIFLFLGSFAFLLPIPILNILVGYLYGLIGVLVLIFAILDILAGVLMWDCKKSGGILALISSIAGIILEAFFLPISILGILINLVTILLVAVGWSEMK